MYNFSSHVIHGTLPKSGLSYYSIDKCNNMSTDYDVFLVIQGGSSIEKDSEHGISHLLEHMSVLGVLYSEEQDFLSFPAYIQAFTNFNETVFQFVLKNASFSYLSKCISIAKNILTQKGLYEKTLTLAKTELINELEKMNPSLSGTLNAIPCPQLNKLKIPAGNLSCINRLRLEDVIEHHKKWCLPEESSIIISSNFESFKIAQLLMDVFENNVSVGNFAWNEQKIPTKITQREHISYEKQVPNITLLSIVERDFHQLDKYMLLSIGLHIALDALVMKMKRFSNSNFITVSVEIISIDLWLIRFEIQPQCCNDCSDILKKFRNLTLSVNAYSNAKRRYANKALQFRQTKKAGQPLDLFVECIANFLYDEPIFDVVDEADYILRVLPNVNYNLVRSKFEAITKCLVVSSHLK